MGEEDLKIQLSDLADRAYSIFLQVTKEGCLSAAAYENILGLLPDQANGRQSDVKKARLIHWALVNDNSHRIFDYGPRDANGRASEMEVRLTPEMEALRASSPERFKRAAFYKIGRAILRYKREAPEYLNHVFGNGQPG